MQKTLLLFLIPLVSLSFAFSQPPEACLRTYEVLTTPTTTSPEDLSPGAIVFLSQSYLDDLKRGVYARMEAGLHHYEYIRPGTREEVRDGLNPLASENEVLGPDGNVYKQVLTPAGIHFFKPRKGFHGEYEPEWRDPFLIAPTGLSPVDVRFSEGLPLQVLEFQPSFLRLRAGEDEWVFFTGFPELSKVFDAESVRKKLAEKQRTARGLEGQQFLLELLSPAEELMSLHEAPVPVTPGTRFLEITVTEAIAEHNRVLVGYGNPIRYLIINDQTKVNFYDLACIRESLIRDLLSDPQQVAEDEAALSDLMLRDVPVAEWSQNGELVGALESRFRLQQDDRMDRRWYEHALLLRDEVSRETFLTARLREDGECFLQSHYASRQGLYHTRVEIDLPSDPLVSTRVSTMDPNSQRIQSGNWTIETITFESDADNLLLLALVDEPDRPVMVRYIAGGSFFKEVELTPEYRRIIRDMYLMGELIRFRNQER